MCCKNCSRPGAYTVYGRILDENNSYSTCSTLVTVNDAQIVPTGGFTVTANARINSGTETVATFTDPGGIDLLSAYAANIAWGDGSTSTGTIAAANGVFTVSSSHMYAAGGS